MVLYRRRDNLVLTSIRPDPTRKKYALFIGPEIDSSYFKNCLSQYKSNNLIFAYPCTWNISEDSPEKFVWITSPRKLFTVHIPAPNFEKYENIVKKGFSHQYNVKDIQITHEDITYPGKVFTHHGGIEYVFKVDDNYVGVWAEGFITDDVS